MSRVRPNLDHLRWIAAFAVVFQHARSLVMIDYHPDAGLMAKALYFATGFSHQAVVIFFVLSGYLVGGAAIRLIRESNEDQRRRFALDRFVRIFIVLLPALALTGLVALLSPPVPVIASGTWGSDIPDAVATSSATAWIGTSFLVNEILTRTTPYNGALWSLAYEWSYYVFAAAAIFVANIDRRAIPVALYAVVLFVLCAFLAPMMLAMGLLWLAGAAASCIKGPRLPALTLLMFLGSLLITRFDLIGPFAEDLLMACATALLIADRSFQDTFALERAGYRLASFSYSLYAIHWPVMLAVIVAMQSNGFLLERLAPGIASYAMLALLVAASYAAALLFAHLTELRTTQVKAWITARSARARDTVPAAR